MLRACARARRALSSASGENYFRLLGVDETFSLDPRALAAQYKLRQREWHPDRFGTRPHSEQERAADMSARVNEAYSVLKAPHRRARHLLRVRTAGADVEEAGVDDADDADDSGGDLEGKVMDPEFLMWVVDFRERVTHAAPDVKQIALLKEEAQGHMQKCLAALTDAFEFGHLDAAAEETVKLQYLRRIVTAIEEHRIQD